MECLSLVLVLRVDRLGLVSSRSCDLTSCEHPCFEVTFRVMDTGHFLFFLSFHFGVIMDSEAGMTVSTEASTLRHGPLHDPSVCRESLSECCTAISRDRHMLHIERPCAVSL